MNQSQLEYQIKFVRERKSMPFRLLLNELLNCVHGACFHTLISVPAKKSPQQKYPIIKFRR